MLTCFAPSSVQQKFHDLRLCMYDHNRKGWLFSNTVKGAVASVNLFSIVETAKANGVEPNAYLSLLFAQLPYAKTVLLPWNVKTALGQDSSTYRTQLIR